MSEARRPRRRRRLHDELPARRLRWDDLAPGYPRVIYASGSGFGEDGPDGDRPAYDTVVYWSRSGIESAMFPAEHITDPRARKAFLTETNG